MDRILLIKKKGRKMMKKRISVKCIVLMLTAIALAALAGIGVMAAGSTGNIIEYRGRSLRIDGDDSGSKTSLRFGYTIKLPEGATPAATEEGGADWISWEYTMDGKRPEENPNSKKSADAKSVIVNKDGTYTANLVITNIPSAYYRRSFYAQMTVKYVDAEGNNQSTTTDVWRSTTIKEVADAIKNTSPSERDEKYEQDTKYADTLDKEIGTFQARIGDKMYDFLPNAIKAVDATGGTVSVLKAMGVTKPITIETPVTLENEEGTPVVVRDRGVPEGSSMITVAGNGELTIAGNGLTIWGDIKAEGNITLEKGTIKGTVELSNEEGGKSLSVGEKGSLLVDSDTKVGGLTSAETGERTKPLLTLLDESANLPQIHISETKAGTVVMEIPESIINHTVGSTIVKGIAEKDKENLTHGEGSQLMWEETSRKVIVEDIEKHIHCACGGNVSSIAQCGTNHWDVVYDKLESTTKAHLGGNYYLAEDITIDKGLGTSTGSYSLNYGKTDLNLCLNGHTLTGNGAKRILYTDGKIKLNVTGVCPESKKTVGTNDSKYGSLKTGMASDTMQGSCLYSTRGGVANLYKVYLDGSGYGYNGNNAGSTLYNAGNNLKMYDCQISKNQSVTKEAYNVEKPWTGLTEVDPATMQPLTQ